ncbi:hypothetical protein A6R68_13312 [Neotoma lepida]|uniref:Uncharacterized protein n=1 Tax=Neotoma lepida TaxID=56216 RepID=A0A1A6H158_NEOLE|nr:hypothetical protein A6R68_13312 [Neotoma lepida]
MKAKMRDMARYLQAQDQCEDHSPAGSETLFTTMVLKAKKEAPAHNKAEKTVLRGILSPRRSALPSLWLWRQHKHPPKSMSRGNKLDHDTVIKSPTTTTTTQADKHQIEKVMRKLYDSDTGHPPGRCRRSFARIGHRFSREPPLASSAPPRLHPRTPRKITTGACECYLNMTL